MLTTASGDEKTNKNGEVETYNKGCDGETKATGNDNIARQASDGKVLGSKKKQQVCHACQHLYGQNTEVVLTPAALCHDHKPVSDAKENLPSRPLLQAKTWKARRYDGLCRCNEAGQECHCNISSHRSYTRYLQISASTLWGPRIKRTLLVIAAIIPFIFLIVYLVFTYI